MRWPELNNVASIHYHNLGLDHSVQTVSNCEDGLRMELSQDALLHFFISDHVDISCRFVHQHQTDSAEAQQDTG